MNNVNPIPAGVLENQDTRAWGTEAKIINNVNPIPAGVLKNQDTLGGRG